MTISQIVLRLHAGVWQVSWPLFLRISEMQRRCFELMAAVKLCQSFCLMIFKTLIERLTVEIAGLCLISLLTAHLRAASSSAK